MSHVVVVGGGITGLAAAFELTGGAAPSPGAPAVTVLEAGALGGKLQVGELGDRRVDVGPDGFLARRPEATSLVADLGAKALLEPVGASGAWIYARGRLRRLPEGLALGIPTKVRDLRPGSALGILGPLGATRAALDLVIPRRARRSALQDRAVGALVGDKLGHRVVDALVDPLVGGIHAGRVRDLSAAAIYPQLLEAGQRRGSLMRALQGATGATGAPSAPQGPAFLTLRDGLGSLPELLCEVLEARGVTILRDTAAAGLERGGPGGAAWGIGTGGSLTAADAVVLAVPAPAAADLLEPLDAAAAGMLRTIDAASVATVSLRCAQGAPALPDGGTGLLVPSPTRFSDDDYLVTAATFLDRKWPHLGEEGVTLLRASVGRVDDVRFLDLDDAALTERVAAELSSLLGGDVQPAAALVTRWPAAFPQYRVNHLARVAAIEAGVRALGGVAVAGAAYRGVGVPACIASGRGAARELRTWLASRTVQS